jgi:hypothetical protein
VASEHVIEVTDPKLRLERSQTDIRNWARTMYMSDRTLGIRLAFDLLHGRQFKLKLNFYKMISFQNPYSVIVA